MTMNQDDTKSNLDGAEWGSPRCKRIRAVMARMNAAAARAILAENEEGFYDVVASYSSWLLDEVTSEDPEAA